VSDIAVIGCGYVGSVSAACLASLGHRVRAVDVDEERVACLRRADPPFVETGLPALLRHGQRAGRLAFGLDARRAVRDADAVLICVATPTAASGRSDLTQLWGALTAVAPALRHDAVVVLRSTVPVGTGDACVEAVREASPMWSGEVVTNPEFLREGTAVHDFLHPDRLVFGGPAAAVAVVEDLYRPLLVEDDPVVFRMDRRSAELVKAGGNAALAAKISLANELADLCERTGADARTVLPAIGADTRIGASWLGPGLGWGGSCLPKDLAALVETGDGVGLRTPLLRAVGSVNAERVTIAMHKLHSSLGTVRGRRIAVLGVAFKAGTDDLRSSPSLALCARLLDEGATVVASDPLVRRLPDAWRSVPLFADPYEAARSADAVVLTVPSNVAQDLVPAPLARAMRGDLVLDLPNALDPAPFVAAGLTVVGTGWAPAAVGAGEVFLTSPQG
jgi:nucleotide sugar dehydrogenase